MCIFNVNLHRKIDEKPTITIAHAIKKCVIVSVVSACLLILSKFALPTFEIDKNVKTQDIYR